MRPISEKSLCFKECTNGKVFSFLSSSFVLSLYVFVIFFFLSSRWLICRFAKELDSSFPRGSAHSRHAAFFEPPNSLNCYSIKDRLPPAFASKFPAHRECEKEFLMTPRRTGGFFFPFFVPVV